MLTRRDFFMAAGAAALGSASARPASEPPRSAPDAEAQGSGQAAGNQANAVVQDMDPWATRIVTSTEESDRWEAWERTLQAGLQYDLLIKGGTVIDPGQHLHAPLDVAVKNGKIAQVSRDIPPDAASRVVSAKNKLVTPGLIDLHIHCCDGLAFNLNHIDGYCMGRGTTTAIDAGSTGYLGISRFVKDVVNTSRTRLYGLVHICPVGATTTLVHLMDDLDNVNPQLTAKAAEANKPAVVGIKIHLSTVYFSNPKDFELVCLKKALEAAELAHLPLMVHINQTYYPLPVSLKMLRKGDIYTHCFSQWPIDNPLDANGKVLPEVREAKERGVIFDVSSGFRHLSFDVAEKCIQQGLLPDTISTDLNRMLATERVYDLPTEVSKFLALGMDLDKAIECVTVNPAKVFNYGVQIGTLQPGSEADIGIFELREGNFQFRDINGASRVGRHRLVNKAVVCRGEFFVNEV
jgi:dihydroorotase